MIGGKNKKKAKLPRILRHLQSCNGYHTKKMPLKYHLLAVENDFEGKTGRAIATA